MLIINKKLPEEQDQVLRDVYAEFNESSKALGTRFYKTVHLYNHIHT